MSTPVFVTWYKSEFNLDAVIPPTSEAPLKNTYDSPPVLNPLSWWLTLILKLLFLNNGEVAEVLAEAFVSIGSASSFSNPRSSLVRSKDAVLDVSKLARLILNLRS